MLVVCESGLEFRGKAASHYLILHVYAVRPIVRRSMRLSFSFSGLCLKDRYVILGGKIRFKMILEAEGLEKRLEKTDRTSELHSPFRLEFDKIYSCTCFVAAGFV